MALIVMPVVLREDVLESVKGGRRIDGVGARAAARAAA
jgi:hypothetical protein